MARRDEIKADVEAMPVPVLAVPTPELPKWEGQIYVTRISPRAINAVWNGEEDQAIDERARFVCRVACDKEGSRIFQDEDVIWLSTCDKLTPMVERLYWAGLDFNGLTAANRESWRKN